VVSITQETFRLTSYTGDTYLFSGPLHVTQHVGLGLVGSTRAIRRGSQQHGQTLSMALLRPRIITLKLYLDGTDETTLRTEREKVEEILADINNPAYLDVTLPSGSVRRLDVYHYDGFTGERNAGDPYYAHADTLQLIADDPVAYNSTPVIESFDVNGGGVGWPIAWIIPWTVGTSAIDALRNVTYAGTWESYPVVTFTGPMEDPYVENQTSGDKLDLTGTTINAGDYYEVDCRYGYKRVLDSTGTDQTSKLTTDSDLATFKLAPPPIAASGLNVFHVYATGMTGASSITITYYLRYWGVI